MLTQKEVMQLPCLRKAAFIADLMYGDYETHLQVPKRTRYFLEQIKEAGRELHDELTDVDSLFLWRETNQGHEYWKALHKLSLLCFGNERGSDYYLKLTI